MVSVENLWSKIKLPSEYAIKLFLYTSVSCMTCTDDELCSVVYCSVGEVCLPLIVFGLVFFAEVEGDY